MKFTPAVSKEDTRLRLRIFSFVVLFILGLLVVRLAQMQIIDRERYAVEAEGNAVEEKILRPARGYIFDRNGILLVDNETTLSVTVSPRRFDEEDIPLVAEIAQLPESLIRGRYEEIVQRSTYQTDILLRDVSFNAFARLQEAQYRIPGLGFEESQRRRYHSEARLSHVLGYVREISANRLEEMEEQGYRMGDMVGMAGVEQEYETVLRGRVGRKYVLVN
ncbi:MAG: penicillin-binding protein 2, partial [Rubricoccaceae bacterium]|nr:penicillin-binding protein 2 [Rubricoccaceae bacterium]